MMTVSAVKMHYRKLPPKIINYMDHKKFTNGNFLSSVKNVFSNKNSNEENGGIDFFHSICSEVRDKHAPLQKSLLAKEIMKRSKLRNKILETRNDTDDFNCNKQKKLLCIPYTKRKNKLLCKSKY